jgi:redox-sensitive bicupin YhaK (pirin superfamily)
VGCPYSLFWHNARMADPVVLRRTAGALGASDPGAGAGIPPQDERATSRPIAEIRIRIGGAIEAIWQRIAERAAYVIDGTIACGTERAERGRMIVFAPGAQVALHAITDARIALLGGAPLDGERHIWWNFVSSSKDRIEQAKEDWKEGRFPKVPGDEAEFIPLPE